MTNGVPAHDQVERAVLEGQRGVVGDLDHRGPERAEVAAGYLQVRRPGLCCRQLLREVLYLPEHLGEDLASSGLDIHDRVGPTHPLHEQPCVAPRRALFGGPPFEPREVPALYGHRRSLGDQFLERLCQRHYRDRGAPTWRYATQLMARPPSSMYFSALQGPEPARGRLSDKCPLEGSNSELGATEGRMMGFGLPSGNGRSSRPGPHGALRLPRVQWLAPGRRCGLSFIGASVADGSSATNATSSTVLILPM